MELIVVMLIVGILAGFISMIISYEADAYNKLVNQTKGLQVSRNALQLMARDFRHIMSADSIIFATQDSIKFDLLDDVPITYRFNNDRILRNGDLLVDAVQNMEFAYFDTLGAQLAAPVTNPADIISISINLSTYVSGQPFNLRTKVQPRNF